MTAPVLVIAHRGASGYRPEHTLASYELAAELGADCIEPDLVITRDGVLVARHENEIGATTDVADHPEFASRHATKVIDGRTMTGWFTEDFTLAELKTLRARERLPELRSTAHDGLYEIPTLEEVLALRERLGVIVYPETKHPSYFRSIGLPLEEPLAAALSGVPRDRVFVQSFEADSLRRLHARRVLLVTTPPDFAAVAAYADAVGPAKEIVDTGFVAAAHAAGLLVHPWTFRAERAFLPPGLDLVAELRRYIEIGVDGFFTDNPDLGVQAIRGSAAG